MLRPILPALLIAFQAAAATRVVVTVVEQKSAKPLNDLNTADFVVTDDGAPRRVESAEYAKSLTDIMLLLDTSLVGEMVQPLANNLIEQLAGKEQMAIVSFHSAADLIQDFTSSRELLRRAVVGVKYGNNPRVLDALYAGVEGGFQSSSFRRVVLILTTGVEGPSRVTEREVVRLARRNGVSIFPIYMVGSERDLFERLARQTGGACFNLRDMRKAVSGPPGVRIFEVLRGHYTLTLTGNLALGDRVKVEVRRPVKTFVSALPLE